MPKKYADLRSIVVNAVKRYVYDVRNSVFPADEHYFHMKNEDYKELVKRLSKQS